MKQAIFSLIKIASTLLITAAFGLELWYGSTLVSNLIFPEGLYPVFWLGSLAIVAHFIEGVIAAVKVKRDRQDFISYGVYTFFVGFVGFLELKESK